jgi:hypothetical protein
VPKSRIAARLLPVIAVLGVVALSWAGAGKVSFNSRLVACVGYGTGYGYVGSPSVTDVNPALGPTNGGTTTTITGLGFCDFPSAVTFGATPASSFTVNSDTSITAVTPVHALGVVDVHVTTVAGTSASNPGDRFGFVTSGIYTLDGYGGFHPDDSAPITNEAYWGGWRIARSAHAWTSAGATQQGFTLDGYGGLHVYGPATPAFAETAATKGNHYWGWDIARDFAFLPNGTGGFVLDGYGGLHGFGINTAAAPTAVGYSYFGVDVAIKVVIAGDGLGGYTLDAYGGLHPFGIGGVAPQTTPILNTGYWSWKAAQDIALIPGQNGGYTGYVLDKFGGLHPFSPTGTALPPAITTSYFGFDIARGLFFLSGSSTDGYTLDGYGGPHAFGSAPVLHSYPYWAGWDIAIQMFGA